MDRRDFLKKTIGGGIAAGSTLAFPGVGKLFAAPKGVAYDLVAVRGGEPCPLGRLSHAPPPPAVRVLWRAPSPPARRLRRYSRL